MPGSEPLRILIMQIVMAAPRNPHTLPHGSDGIRAWIAESHPWVAVGCTGSASRGENSGLQYSIHGTFVETSSRWACRGESTSAGRILLGDCRPSRVAGGAASVVLQSSGVRQIIGLSGSKRSIFKDSIRIVNGFNDMSVYSICTCRVFQQARASPYRDCRLRDFGNWEGRPCRTHCCIKTTTYRCRSARNVEKYPHTSATVQNVIHKISL